MGEALCDYGHERYYGVPGFGVPGGVSGCVRVSRIALQPVLCAVHGSDECIAGLGIELCLGDVFAGVGLIQAALVCADLTHALGFVHLRYSVSECFGVI